MINILKAVIKIIYQRVTSKICFLVVDFHEINQQLTFLCYGGRAFFKKELAEAALDDKLISGLSPDQACFIGIKLGQLIKKTEWITNKTLGEKIKMYSQKSFVTVKNSIAFDRKGNLIYFDSSTNKIIIEKARIVAGSRKLIMQFDSILACRIGVFVGSSLEKTEREESKKLVNRETQLGNVVLFKKRIG